MYVHVRTLDMYACTHVHKYVCMYTYIYFLGMHVHMYLIMYVCTCTYIVYVCIVYTCMYVCMYMYIHCTCICTHVPNHVHVLLIIIVKASTWTERLYILEKMEANMCTLAAGSYQNIAIVNNNRYACNTHTHTHTYIYNIHTSYNYYRLLTWGAGKFGQLGNGMRQDYPDPKDISQSLNTPSTVVQVSITYIHLIWHVLIYEQLE